MMFTQEEHEERARNGLAWLKENYPDKVKDINVSTLDMANPLRCALGQTLGYFATSDSKYEEFKTSLKERDDLPYYEVVNLANNMLIRWLVTNGFYVHVGFAVDLEREYTELTAAWKRVLREERGIREPNPNALLHVLPRPRESVES